MSRINSGAVVFQKQSWLGEQDVISNDHFPPVGFRFNPNGFSITRDLIAYFDKRMNSLLSGTLDDPTGEKIVKTAQYLNNALVVFARYATTQDAPESGRDFVRLTAPEYVQKIKSLNKSGRMTKKVDLSELKSLLRWILETNE